jgi:crossover junction endodeoxyribonuclease RusA
MEQNKITYDHDRYLPQNGGQALWMVPPGCAPVSREAISAWVAGVPAPQGSKRALGAGRPGGRIRLVESSTKVKPWRADVRAAFERGVAAPRGRTEIEAGVPLVVKIVFVMPRTKAMRNRPSADFPMVQKPDVDKLQRAVLDALTSAGVYSDDSQVVGCYGFKRRGEPGEATGAMIHIEQYREADVLPTEISPVMTPEETAATNPVRHRLNCPARVRDVVCTCGAVITPDRLMREVDGSFTASTDVNTTYDTPETVEAKMRGVRQFMDQARKL